MSVESMKEAVLKQKITDLYNTIFVQKWVFLPTQVKNLIDSIDEQPLEVLTDLNKAIFAARYRAVHDVSIALNEFVETFNGDVEMKITKDVEWGGYINGTEEPITAHLSEGTVVNLLEFLEAPHEGLIFQLTLGHGPEGKHFNIVMDEALENIDMLVDFVNAAYNRRLADKDLDIDQDFYLGEITDEKRAELEAIHGEIKEYVPHAPFEEHEKMEITEAETDDSE